MDFNSQNDTCSDMLSSGLSPSFFSSPETLHSQVNNNNNNNTSSSSSSSSSPQPVSQASKCKKDHKLTESLWIQATEDEKKNIISRLEKSRNYMAHGIERVVSKQNYFNGLNDEDNVSFLNDVKIVFFKESQFCNLRISTKHGARIIQWTGYESEKSRFHPFVPVESLLVISQEEFLSDQFLIILKLDYHIYFCPLFKLPKENIRE